MSNHDLDYERKDIDTQSVIHVGVAVAIVTVACSVLVLFFFNYLGDRAKQADPPNPPLARHEQGRQPPEPRLQEMPFKDIAALRAEEGSLLSSFGWVDEKTGIARIPVADAIKIVAAQGLPAWPAVAASPTPAPGAKPR